MQAASQNASLPTSGTFGKVFNSLQGLQQRLDDFSLDDLSTAIDQTRTLSLRLADLQRRLGTLIAIRHFTNATSRAIEKATLEIRDLSNLETVNQASRLAPMPQARKLINFPRPFRSASDGSLEVGKSPTEPAIGKNNGNAHTTHEPPAVPQPTDNVGIDQEWSLASDLAAFDASDEWTLESSGSTAPAEQPFVQYDPSEPQRIETPDTDVTDGLGSVGATMEPTASPEDESGETLVSPLPETDEEPTPVATTPESVQGRALVPAGTDFDQRLLDDLIKDYGEFASSPNVPATITPKKEIQQSKDNQDSQTATLSADEVYSASRHLPSIQKEGEIDRKLKKLIKDYGEYDLYSRQSPVNLKTGVIGAFLLLGLIFAGFYFFSPPKTVDSTQPSLIAEPAAISAPNGASLQNNKKDEAVKTPKGARGAAAGLPQTIEAKKPNTPDPTPLDKKN